MSQTEAEEQQQDGVLHRLADAYTRHRTLLFAIVVLFLLISFNGQWIVERDTSLFRGLGHALATGRGYTFGEFASRVVYPGLPLMLAGLELTFGETALPAILLMNVMALATLVVTYRLVRLHFAEWIAVAVTVGVGLNARFVQASQEIMTDIPFLLGVVLFLYGWERLQIRMKDEGGRMKDEVVGARLVSPSVQEEGETSLAPTNHPHPNLLPAYREKGQGKVLRPLAYLIPGLILSLSMRPTFWILGMAWGMVCLWGLYRGPRQFYATCLIVVIGVALAWFVLDPRTRGFNPLGGGYEQHFVGKLGRTGSIVLGNLPDLIGRQLAALFFGGRFGAGITHVITLALIGSTWLLFRRGLVLWGLLILCTLAVTLAIEVVPRYYLMILPVLMVAYVLLFRELATRAGPKWGPLVFNAGVVLLLAPNVARASKFVYAQHWDDPGKRKTWARSILAAEMVKDYVPQGAAVLAPGAPIVSYLSGRQVYLEREIFREDKGPMSYPQDLAKKKVQYAIFPSSRYRDNEPIIAQLIDRGVIVPTGVVTRDSGLTLATVEVVVPPDGHDWRNNPVTDYAWVTTTRRGPTSDQVRRQQRLRREANEARLRRERSELKAKLEARRAREAKAAREAREMRERIEARKKYEARLAREARERQAANARRLKRLRQQAATQATQPTTRPTTPPATTQPVAPPPVPPVPPLAAPPTSQPVSLRLEGDRVVVISPFFGPITRGI